MAFASGKKRSTPPAAKTDEQTEKEGAESTETPSASFEKFVYPPDVWLV